MPLEVIAGEDDYMVEHKESGAIFRFNYKEVDARGGAGTRVCCVRTVPWCAEQVYWNSRLSTEHLRLVEEFAADSVVCALRVCVCVCMCVCVCVRCARMAGVSCAVLFCSRGVGGRWWGRGGRQPACARRRRCRRHVLRDWPLRDPDGHARHDRVRERPEPALAFLPNAEREIEQGAPGAGAARERG
jgi:hypothetical protein